VNFEYEMSPDCCLLVSVLSVEAECVLGSEITASHFQEGQFVDIRGTGFVSV
jgi:hypothetical protein